LIAVAGDNRNGHRDSTMILVAYRHGLRAAEVVTLRWDAIDFGHGRMHVNRAKNGSPSVHPLSGRELRALRRLQREQEPQSPFVFTSERGAPFTPAGFRKMVARLGMLGILKRLEANGRHLLGLINDVLDLSKIEAGQLVLELSDYCIQDIAQTVRSTLEPLAADKKLAFKVEMAPKLPPGHGDGRRLTQVLINLVGNAIKFTDAGEVAIKAEANNGSFFVSVRDTGPGISAVDKAKLFQEFQQADNAITRKKGGTGLGLAISKRIIEMHGGRIWVESQPGQGSTFTFTLPVIVERQVETA